MPFITATPTAASPPLRFSPRAQARSTTRKPNSKPPNYSRGRSPNPNLKTRTRYKPPPQPVPLTDPAGEATTYTSLPPREDFLVPSLSPVNEVKLSDSNVARLETSEFKSSSRGEEEDEVDLVEKIDDSEVIKYTVLDVFEGNSGGVEEDESDWDDDDDAEDFTDEIEDAEEVLGLDGGKIVSGYDSEGNKVKAKLFGVGDDDDDDDAEDYTDEIEDAEEVLGFDGGQIVSSYDSEGNKYTAKLYTVGDDEDDAFDGENSGSGAKTEKGFEEDEEQVKEKGVPAVMRCFDRAKIFVKAGDGGNGVVAFRREKFVPLGGPSGGDGGRGGNVYVEVDGSMNSLLPFRNSVHFRAGRGSHGQGSKMAGAKGEEVVVKVAPGTVIREAGKEEVLLELLHPGQRALLLPGGRGGRGNASFKTGMNKAPRIAENGEQGPEMWLDLELKLVADVGIVGAPNAGKSTLLSAISAAQPEIANYPYTTLLPNLGVVSFNFDSTIVVADLPGLLEGAHRGFGLGHEFLRHTERCSALVHVVDGSAEQPEFEYDAVRLELELFNPEIAEKPYIVAFNKMDLPEAYEKWPSFKERLEARGIHVFCMSAVRRDGTHQVISTAYDLLQKSKESRVFEGWMDNGNLNHVAEKVKKERKASIDEFEITHDSSTSTWHVNGSGLQRFIQMTNWRYMDSERRFQHVLEASGVFKSLTRLGVKEGDTVIVGELEMVWHDSKERMHPSNASKKGFTRFT